MSNIVLGAATQQNLLALQNVNTQLATTQNQLATGLKVSSAIDNAVAYFESQSLDNRATDLSTRKDSIDQGISSVTTATQGISSAISIAQQLQGIVQAAKTENATERASAAVQFNTLTVQLNQLLNDSSYQGLNLVNSSTSNLTLQFSQSSASTLKIAGQNLLVSNLTSKADVATKIAYTGGTSAGSGHSAASGYSAFEKYSLATHGTGHTAGSHHSAGSGASLFKVNLTSSHIHASALATALAGAKFSSAVSNGKASAFDTAYNSLNNVISSLQAAAQSLGSNVTFLNTRLAFTSQYITTLQGGASKLTVADVNVASTNLVTLQTRQSLAIQSLSIATQAEQSVLKLFH
jgi:flagellin